MMRVATVTLGCKVNQYDSATLETKLREADCQIVDFTAGAHVYVINTCTVTDRADSESRQLARRARRLNPQARIVMTGCFAQINPHAALIPEVDHVVGLNRLGDLIQAVRGELQGAIAVDDLRAVRRVRTLGADTFVGQTRAFLKVQEGCNLFCTFCIVPFARGASRSVPPREILDQLKMLARRGYAEVVLTGVHLGGYGNDLAPRQDLADLLEMLLEHSPVLRLRLSSVDPPEITPRLLRLFSGPSALCPHLHVPVQAAHDGVLARMRRRYDDAFLDDVFAEIRHALPDAAIGTDVIGGFPGETEAQFEGGLEALSRLPITYFHVFPYSKRVGTTAARLGEQVPPSVVHERARRLRRLGEAKRADFARTFVGRDLRVLIEGGSTTLAPALGYARNYQRVAIHGQIAANREVDVRIEEARGSLLIGKARPMMHGTTDV